ncbi:protein tyrosine phosphatase [Polaromonas sp. YR568]|uniref:arsenate reductase/protein-tyrosine-phosphatase family protein n=1 Tax=Polaromonas sp. YR568 TaxID=1855301 RepID=UPI0008F09554|nr:hypothetical protein [Polaromonas sp. YR568]SFV03564.1 protein tyrosine phosphatase [Polaromonas sp. YR568]
MKFNMYGPKMLNQSEQALTTPNYEASVSPVSRYRGHILVVGYGNVCRSPMAEQVIARRMPELTVVSAGLNTVNGQMADLNSRQIAKANSLNLEHHRSKRVSYSLCKSAQLVLAMETDLATTLKWLFPMAHTRIFRIGEFRDIDVVDPYCQTRDMFELAFRQIELCVDGWIPHLEALRGRSRER